MVNRVVGSLVFPLLLVVFNIGVSDALSCWKCSSWSWTGICGSYFDTQHQDLEKEHCVEKPGMVPVCVTWINGWGGFGWSIKTHRYCSHRVVGSSACTRGDSCQECNHRNYCNSNDYPPRYSR